MDDSYKKFLSTIVKKSKVKHIQLLETTTLENNFPLSCQCRTGCTSNSIYLVELSSAKHGPMDGSNEPTKRNLVADDSKWPKGAFN
jgi:hypothetical protein